MKLSELKPGQKATIHHIQGTGSFRARLGEMGFVAGKEIRKIYSTPLGNPIVFQLMGGQIALRKDEAQKIIVTQNDKLQLPPHEQQPTQPDTTQPIPPKIPIPTPCTGGCPTCNCTQHRHTTNQPPTPDTVTIALVGNPNSGKTSLFNAISGGHEHTGNYSGVTVNTIVGQTTYNGRRVRLIDLPGTYSLRAFSPEEAYVAHELSSGHIDSVINVIDTTNLERNLLLTLQLQERNIPMVCALNMFDEFTQSKSRLDIPELTKRLGISLHPTVARQRKGLDQLMQQAIALADRHIALHQTGIQGHTHTADCLTEHTNPTPCPQDKATYRLPSHQLTQTDNCPCPERDREDAERYTHIAKLLNGIYKKQTGPANHITDIADKLLAHRWIAYPLFIIIMWFMFWTTFAIGQYPMDWIDAAVETLTTLCQTHLPPGIMTDLLTDGILASVGSVIVFLPNILILYLFISILEDTGYLARAAMLADPLLSRLGLHGKSFIPMLMGYGCNVPAIMATRTIENPKSRLITMLVTPMMSCSARIPVYVVFAGAFFPNNAPLVLLALYLLGTATALLTAWLFNKIFMRTQQSHFVMELPPYRLPSPRDVVRHTWEKGRQYLRKMGGIILFAGIIIWALGRFPQGAPHLTETQQQEQSFMGRIGHTIEPIIKPLGYDWRMGVGIIAGIGAKELMVSTISVLYNCTAEEADVQTPDQASQTRLARILSTQTTPEAALSYMIFALFYFPCIATIAAVKTESGTWRRALFTAVYTTLLAYTMAFIVYRIALLF